MGCWQTIVLVLVRCRVYGFLVGHEGKGREGRCGIRWGTRPPMLVILSRRCAPPSLILVSRRSRRRRAARWAGDSSGVDILGQKMSWSWLKWKK